MAKRLIEIEITGARDLRGRFVKATNELLKANREELRELGRRTVTVLREEAPVRTGRLRKGLGFKTYERGNNLELRVTSEAPYTVLVIRGRGPVVARHAKALRFEPGPPGSGFIFRKRVGPAKANPFQARALNRLRGEPYEAAGRIGARVVQAWAGR